MKVIEDEVEKQFRTIVCDHLGVSPEQCVPQARIVEDLGADELDPIELAMSLETAFHICFTDDEISGFTTYGNLLSLVKEKFEQFTKEAYGRNA